MPETRLQSVRNYIDRRLIVQLRIFSIIFLIMVGVIVVDVFLNKIGVSLAIVGMLVGIVLGVVASRMFRLGWDEQAVKVVSRIDWIGGVILIVYIAFMFERNWLFGHWIAAPALVAFGLSMSAGTMLGRVVGTGRGIQRTLQAIGILKRGADTGDENSA